MDKCSAAVKRAKIYCLFVGIFAFLLALLLSQAFFNYTEKEMKMSATYTAQSTVKRINAHLVQYVALSDFLENMINSGYELNESTFSKLASGFRLLLSRRRRPVTALWESIIRMICRLYSRILREC